MSMNLKRGGRRMRPLSRSPGRSLVHRPRPHRSRSPRPRHPEAGRRSRSRSRSGSRHRSRSGERRRPSDGYGRMSRGGAKRLRSPPARRHSISPPRKIMPRKRSPVPRKPSPVSSKRRSTSPGVRRKLSPGPSGDRGPSPRRLNMPVHREPSRPVNTIGMSKHDYMSPKRRRSVSPLPPRPADNFGDPHLKPSDNYRFKEQRYEEPGYRNEEVLRKIPTEGLEYPPDTKQLLDDRFRGGSEGHAFNPEELKKITVDIIRNIPRDNEPIVRRILHPEDVILVRRPGEGCRPIFERDELKSAMGDDEFTEKRVVAIVRDRSRSISPDRRVSNPPGAHENFKVQRDKYPYSQPEGYQSRPSLSDRWQPDNRDRRFGQSEKLLVSVRSRSPMGQQPDGFKGRSETGSAYDVSRPRSTSYYDETNGSRYPTRERDGSHYHSQSSDSLRRSLPTNPNDLRHSLLSRGRPSDLVDARQRILERREREREPSHGGRVDYRPSEISSDSRHRFPDDRNKVGSFNFWDRDKSGRDGNGYRGGDVDSGLPNFSSRPDRYQYKEWVDKPDMVPKGPSYYEHDNRGDGYYRRGARGRGIRGSGMFRGRGSFRGPMRGGYPMRGRDSRPMHPRGKSSPSQWEHDMFEKSSPVTKATFYVPHQSRGH